MKYVCLVLCCTIVNSIGAKVEPFDVLATINMWSTDDPAMQGAAKESAAALYVAIPDLQQDELTIGVLKTMGFTDQELAAQIALNNEIAKVSTAQQARQLAEKLYADFQGKVK